MLTCDDRHKVPTAQMGLPILKALPGENR
jgi:hypothetical protein